MDKKYTMTEAFAYFGAEATVHIRQAWSARSADGRTVVLALWKEGVQDDGRNVFTDCFRGEKLDQWIDKHGNKDRIENLAWAEDHCDGLFRVVMVQNEPREYYPDKTLVMRLRALDRKTGEFRAEGVRL